MEEEQLFKHFKGEDEPKYKFCQIVPFWFNKIDKTLHIYLVGENKSPIKGVIEEREGSIMFTIAHALMK